MSATAPPSDRQMLGFRTSAEAIEGSDDLLTKVLLLLPVKPLFGLKLVSKRWLSLISNPLFASLWTPQQVLPSALILQSLRYFEEGPFCFPLDDTSNFKASSTFLRFLKVDDPTDPYIDKIWTPTNPYIRIWSSCDGLILCSCGSIKYKVCNPTTKQATILPPVRENSYHTVLDATLAFDHSVSLHYKVINVGPFGDTDIYSSETNTWSQRQAMFPEEIGDFWLKGGGERFMLDCKGVFFKGAIFWTFSMLNRFCYFDLDTEILHGDYPMPAMDVKYYCGSVNEHLYLVGSVASGSSVSELGGQCDVFELGNDRSSWNLKYRIDLNEVAGHEFHKKLYRTRRKGESFEFGVHSVIMKREGETDPYLALYIPCKAKLGSSWRAELGLPTVHHLIENPFWVGSKVSSIDNHLIENPFWVGIHSCSSRFSIKRFLVFQHLPSFYHVFFCLFYCVLYFFFFR